MKFIEPLLKFQLIKQAHIKFFNSILTKARKDNTYKFALARFIVEYSHEQNESDIENEIKNNETTVINYSVIAKHQLLFL